MIKQYIIRANMSIIFILFIAVHYQPITYLYSLMTEGIRVKITVFSCISFSVCLSVIMTLVANKIYRKKAHNKIRYYVKSKKYSQHSASIF